ncbi:cholesterol transporter ABCA5-like isoform X3 [Homalodisca vitripennis]|uniref:cholesterol transporter ABCA5-like isoform X3 n=1 Tax=Homalodisca vitripennis TaxID=197043 RepID=UPI001EEB4BE1|nr:cholesterol transporter ABCA5-like isoform X3 [Homalodisca vitripennis]
MSRSEEEMLKNYWRNSEQFQLGVVFAQDNPFETGLKYEILTNPSWMKCPDTCTLYAPETACRQPPEHPSAVGDDHFSSQINSINPSTNTDVECPASSYYMSGFAALQTLIDVTKIQVTLPYMEVIIPNITIQILPKEAFTADWMVGIRVIIPLYIVIAMSQFINSLLILIVGEKEQQFKEGMKIAGLKDSVYWSSWFFVYMWIVLITSVAATTILCYLQVFQNTSYLLIFLLTFFYGLSIIVVSFMMTPFFNEAKTAGFLGSFIVNLVSLLYFVQLFAGKSSFTLWSISLLSPAAFALAMDKALLMDLTGKGVTISTLWTDPGFNIGNCLTMLCVDILLYTLVTLYLDSVWPSKYGVRKHPLFCFHYFGRYKENTKEDFYEMEATKRVHTPTDNIEEVCEELHSKEAIRLVGLCKTFSSCKKSSVTVLNNINLVMYTGEITAILGQNGAGKSTLFNILTGLIPVTDGTVYIFNKDIRNHKNMSEIQEIMGVCAQTNILFEDLTAREHLTFFARLKGLQAETLHSSVGKILQDIDLEDKANSQTKDLSGGQKRKLSVGIAIVGDPKIIILDEPTAGIDIFSKRHICSLLQRMKHNKVVLLATHSMDEADEVADRKAILSQGKLLCYGSSLFLKTRFGIGSCLRVELEDLLHSKRVLQIIRSYIPTAKLSHVFGKELHFVLPNESLHQIASHLSLMENELKSTENNLKILSYGVSMSSLEQVFVQLNNNNASETLENDFLNTATQLPQNNTDEILKTHKGELCLLMDVEYSPNWVQMMCAMLRLRILRISRNLNQVSLMIIIPLIFVYLGFHVNKTNYKPFQNSTLLLNPDLYSNVTKIAVYGESKVARKLAREIDPANNTLMVESYNSLLETKPWLGVLRIAQMYNPDKIDVTVLCNDTLQHSLPIILNLFSNSMYRILHSKPKPDGYSQILTVKTRQLPPTSPSHELNTSIIVSSIMVGITFVLFPVSLAVEIINERKNKSKHLLYLNGLLRSVYFSSYVVVLGIVLLAFSLYILVLMLWLGRGPLTDPRAFIVLIPVILAYCPAAILCIICFSYMFNRSQTALSILPTVVTWMGIIPFIVVTILEVIGVGGKVPHFLMSITNIVYVPYSLIYLVQQAATLCDVQPSCSHPNYITMDIASLLLGSLLQIPFWSLILRVLDMHETGGKLSDSINRVMNRKLKSENVNDNKTVKLDINESNIEADEQTLSVNNCPETSSIAVVENLTKKYPNRTHFCCHRAGSPPLFTQALHNLTFSVQQGEVFGLLGHNGAGKTTTLRIISGEEQPTSGSVRIKGQSNITGLLGYCPQHDVFWPNISVREHLEIYAAVRGVKPHAINRMVGGFLSGLLLSNHAEKYAQLCSGGTQRKLSFALSMIGNTSLVLLDEPSTGMDALSKRFLWNIIRNTFQGDKGAILTTHSMEEADALCTRVGILTNGSLGCVGTTQYLKDRYGGGYILEMKLKSSSSRDQVQELIKSKFPGSSVKNYLADRLVFSIPQNLVVSPASVYFLIEQVKSEMGITMYSFDQTNLEHVFLNLSSQE